MRKTGKTARHEELRQFLLMRTRQAKRELVEIRARFRSQAGDQGVLDLTEHAQNGVVTDMDAVMMHEKTALIERYAAALERLRAGTYGQCESCGGEIRTARLQAVPFAERCLDCERSREENGSVGHRPGFSREDLNRLRAVG